MAAIECLALERRFGDVHAVDPLNLTVEAGSILGLVGPNGAGKTTAVRMLTTLLPPTAGTALVGGHDIRHDPDAVRREIGYVPQVLSAEGALTGRENLLIFAKLYDIPRGEREARIEEALSTVGLLEAAGRLARTYSGGMIRRLEVAQALLHRPRILFLDEPTVGLDPVARRAVWQNIEALRQESRMTILLTTHYMEEADQLCDRVAILHRGALVAQGPPTALKAQVGPEATLDDVFTHFTGAQLETGEATEGFQHTKRARRTAKRLG
ncbi:MAG: ABC transporter ATP-binding protein [Thermoplasmatota archaeon]